MEPRTILVFTARQLTMLCFALADLAEAASDGDRPEFTVEEVHELACKVQAAAREMTAKENKR